MLDYDEVLNEVGEFGRWQIWLFALLWIPSAVSAMQVFMYDFIAFSPETRCIVSQCESPSDPDTFDASFSNFTVAEEGCAMFEPTTNTTCQEYAFSTSAIIDCPDGLLYDDSLFSSTAVEDFSMSCENSFEKSLSQTLYMAGMLVGSFAFGYVSDKVGRLNALHLSSVTCAIGGTVSALLPSKPEMYAVFAAMRFVSGMSHAGMFIMSFGLAVEYTGPRWRVFTGCLIETPFAIGGLIVGLLSWAGIRDWRTLQLMCSTPALLLLSYQWIIPESPRWLLAVKKFERLEKDVEKTAKRNRRAYPTEVMKRLRSDHESETGKLDNASASLLDLFRPMPIALRTLNVFYNWLVTTLCYYGLTFMATDLTGNFFSDYSLLIFVEIPAHFYCIFALDRIGRKPILSFSLILSGVCCIVAAFVDGIPWLQLTLALIGKFGAAACFTIVFVYTAEMFPTEIRSTAIGCSSLCGRIGGMLAPQIILLGDINERLPFIVLGGSALLGGIFALINLPETLGKKLPETMEEALNLNKKMTVAVEAR